MKLKPNLRIFITGKTQSGKTYLAKDIISKYPNRVIYDIKRQYGSLGIVCSSIDAMRSLISKGKTSICYQPFDLSIEHFEEVCKFIFYNLKNIVFVVDEAHKFAQKHKIPPHFNSIVTIMEGDPYHVGVIAITQRPANIHNDIISSATIIISFRLNLKSDAEAVTGIPAERIMSLKQYHYLVFDDREAENAITEHSPI